MRYSIIIFVLLTQFLFSQEKTIDSLEQILFKINVDSLQTKKIGEWTKYYRYRDSNLHLHFLTKALKKSIEDKNERNESIWLDEKSLYYRIQGNIDTSLIFSKKALKIAEKLEDFKLIDKSKMSLAFVYQTKGNYAKVIELYNQSLKAYEVNGMQEERGYLITKYNLSGVYYTMEEYQKAVNVLKILSNNDKVKEDQEFLSEVSFQLAAVLYQLDEIDEAIKYAKKAESIEKRPYVMAMIYAVLGSIYTDTKAYKKSNEYQQKALLVFEKMGDKERVIATKQNIGYGLIFLGDFNLAEKQLKEVETILATLENPNLDNLELNYSTLSQLYEKKTDYKKALKYLKKENVVRDSIFNNNKQNIISEIEVKYDTEKTKRAKEVAEKQLVIQELESVKNRNLFIGSLTIAGLLFLASLFYFSRLKAKKKAQLIAIELKETQKRLAIEKQYKDSELKALKAQMNPHFIFNALNSIQDYIILNQKNLASDYLGKFADLIRNYLHFSDTGFISIPDEVHNLNLYLELEKLRFEEQLQYTFKVAETINNEAIKIPTMLIQPYIENALKHGLLHKKDNRVLTISMLKFSDRIIECSIEDNGIGREKSREINKKRATQHKSFALKATTERLNLLNYGREKKIGVQIIDLKEDNKATGTKVILKIPILKN